MIPFHNKILCIFLSLYQSDDFQLICHLFLDGCKKVPCGRWSTGPFFVELVKRVDERFTEQESSLLAEIDLIQERKLRLSSRR